MSLSLGVLHTRLIPISFGYPYVSRQLVALACAQRGRQPTLLSLVDARLSALAPPPARADAALSALDDPSRLDAGFLGRPTVLGVIDTYGIELIHPVREGRSSQQIGRKGLSNHRWIVGGQTLSAAQSMGVDRGVGLCHGQCRR